MLEYIENEDIKRLSEIYDPESRDTFVSLYINLNGNYKRFIDKRKIECISVLNDKELIKNLEDTIEEIKDFIKKLNDKKDGLIIFASHINRFFESFKTQKKLENSLIVDTSPYIKPAADILDGYKRIGLILLDTHRATIFVMDHRLDIEKKISEDIINKHKKGGWSQARFQRIRKGAIEHFMKEVSDYCNSMVLKESLDGIVIAGPGNGKTLLINYLNDNVKRKILDTLDLDFNEDEDKLEYLINKIQEKRKMERDRILIEKLKGEILKDGLAVYGVEETLKKVMEGKAEIVLIEKGLRIEGWVCERCQMVGLGKRRICPYCQNPTSDVDVIEEIVEFAERTDAKVEFLEDDILDKLGGVSALLRFR